MYNIWYYTKKYGKDIILFLLIGASLSLIIYNYYLDINYEEEVEQFAAIEHTEVPEENIDNLIYVDIKGAVKTPGVYQVNSNSIINDIITLAGGFNNNAYKDGINLSKKVSDEMVIYVYRKDEIKVQENITNTNSNEITTTCTIPSYNICECVEENKSIIETNPSSSETLNDIKEENKIENTLINLNTATQSDLTTLSGIGESKAKAIIEYRTTNGNYKNITDIMNVSGIGEALFAKIKDYITV